MNNHLPPLLVHLVFHPESDNACGLARDIHLALNADPNISGLRIPTVFCAENNGIPPIDQGLDRAERSLVVPLADIDMNIDDAWCSFVADLWQGCQDTNHRCIPIQLDEDAWPLDPRLSGVSFVRAFDCPDEERSAFVIRRLIIELCRYLHGDQLQVEDPEAPIKLFISHTKMDLEQEPRVVDSLKKYLSVDQPIKAWFDSGDIPGGSAFSLEIEKGLKDTSLLCVRTDNYSSREWCRKEILLAKKNRRPIVIVNALNSQENRSFPYLGNSPEIRWNENPEAAITLVMKETLRNLHSNLLLQLSSQEGDELFVQPPELLTTIELKAGTRILYPDPPLGTEELSTLTACGLVAETPLERMAIKKSLAGKRIAISVSECPDITQYGLDQLHFRDAVQDLSRYLLIKGARMIYGGHLGFDGFTDTLMNLVVANNRLESIDPIQRIENYIGWPLPLSKKDISKVKQAIVLKRVDRPEDITEDMAKELKADPEYFKADISPIHRYAWARGMTKMRQEQTKSCDVRLVMGGSTGPVLKSQPDGSHEETWYAGRIPGVLEELMLSLKQNQPVFVIGAFGGVAGLVVDLLEGRKREEMTWEYQSNAPHSLEMRELYKQRSDEWWSYDDMLEFLLRKGISGLNSGLTDAEHKELFHTTDIVRMLELIITGLDRLDM